MNDENMPDKTRLSKNILVIILAILLCIVMDLLIYVLQKAAGFACGRIAGNLLFLLLLWIIFYKIRGENIRQLFSPSRKKITFNIIGGYILGIACLLGFISLRLSGREFLILSKSKLSVFGLILFPAVGFVRINGIAVLSVAFVEEVFFRGVILKNALKIFSNKYLASIAVAIIFEMLHVYKYITGKVSSFDTLFILSIMFVYQAMLTYYTIRSRDIAFAIAWHYTYDVTLYRLIGFPTA